jgi:hypothetical protein
MGVAFIERRLSLLILFFIFFAIHFKLTDEHIDIISASKMRYHLAIDILDKYMLYLMKYYQKTLSEPNILSSTVSLLQTTSELINIVCDKNRPISDISDDRISQLYEINDVFFHLWETRILNSKTYTI